MRLFGAAGTEGLKQYFKKYVRFEINIIFLIFFINLLHRYIDSLQAALKLSDESREKLKEEVDGIKEHRNQMVRQIKATIENK